MPMTVPSGSSSHPSTLIGLSYWLIWKSFGMSG
jgi:hypothetical protein